MSTDFAIHSHFGRGQFTHPASEAQASALHDIDDRSFATFHSASTVKHRNTNMSHEELAKSMIDRLLRDCNCDPSRYGRFVERVAEDHGCDPNDVRRWVIERHLELDEVSYRWARLTNTKVLKLFREILDFDESAFPDEIILGYVRNLSNAPVVPVEIRGGNGSDAGSSMAADPIGPGPPVVVGPPGPPVAVGPSRPPVAVGSSGPPSAAASSAQWSMTTFPIPVEVPSPSNGGTGASKNDGTIAEVQKEFQEGKSKVPFSETRVVEDDKQAEATKRPRDDKPDGKPQATKKPRDDSPDGKPKATER